MYRLTCISGNSVQREGEGVERNLFFVLAPHCYFTRSRLCCCCYLFFPPTLRVLPNPLCVFFFPPGSGFAKCWKSSSFFFSSSSSSITPHFSGRGVRRSEPLAHKAGAAISKWPLRRRAGVSNLSFFFTLRTTSATCDKLADHFGTLKRKSHLIVYTLLHWSIFGGLGTAVRL